MKKVKTGRKMLAVNKTAKHDYFIDEVFEAGIVLTGTEIKSLRLGKVNLAGSYAKMMEAELFIVGMNIKPYEQGNRYNADPLRPRKLLLHKKELRELNEEVQREGRTIVPLRVYLNDRGLAKMEIALARGKKLYDKRESIAARDAERRIQRIKMK